MTKSDAEEFPQTDTNTEGDDVVATQNREKLSGIDFYTKILGTPKYIVAPMVDQSELAWRILCRRHGAQLCYSPMLHSNIFARDPKYRRDALQSCPEDRPLIIQFCGNDPQTILEAALLAQDHCDAIDINLGCPQAIAKRGHYGSFLQDEWDLLTNIVSLLHKNLSVPVTCKIRVFEDKQRTINYAKMLEKAGCQMLTVHGRTREQKGPLTGLADWSYIKIVREHVKIPIFANGNIMSLEDVHRCLEETNAFGVMTAEGNLYNPALFDGVTPVAWEIANEYLDIVEKYPCPASYVRGHIFKIFHHLLALKSNIEERTAVAIAHTLPEFRAVVKDLEHKYLPYHEGKLVYIEEEVDSTSETKEKDYNLSLPPWLCHSYVRPPPEEHKQKVEEKQRQACDPNIEKRKYFDDDGNEISRKRMKKLRRIQRRPDKPEGKHDKLNILCGKCGNPLGFKCDYQLCRPCCKRKCFVEKCSCDGHRKPKRDKTQPIDLVDNPASILGNNSIQEAVYLTN